MNNKTNLIDNQFAVTPMLLRTLEAGGFLHANSSFLTAVGYSASELAEKPFLDWINPSDIKVVTSAIKGNQSNYWIAHKTQYGEHLQLKIRIVKNNGESFVIGRSFEKTECVNTAKDSEDEATVSGTLHTIASIIEEQNPGYKCSILLVADGRFIRGAGPSLPEEYNAAIDGYAIGPTVGSCGTAIYWNVPVIVEDIQTDPLWAPFADLAKKAGLAACWSYPFSSTTGNVLGALALYSPVPQAPTKEQLGRLRAAARITGLAVERGRAEEALHIQHTRELELKKQLYQAQKMESIGMLAAGVAHEINNPLAGILQNVNVLKNRLENVEIPANFVVAEELDISMEDVRAFMEKRGVFRMLAAISESGKRASEIVSNMLTFARKSDADLSPHYPDRLMDKTIELASSDYNLKKQFDFKSIEIVREYDENLPMLPCDGGKIQQVILNILRNGSQAMQLADTESPKFIIRIHSDTFYEKVCIEIEDNGPGMDEETRSNVFNPFFTTKPIGVGTGLGLSISYFIITEDHSGTMEVLSEPGKGTTFIVQLPIDKEKNTIKKN